VFIRGSGPPTTLPAANAALGLLRALVGAMRTMCNPAGRAAYDVFLSHSSVDKPAVEAIARRLRDAGLNPFLDRWHLVPGEPWQEALEEALDASSTCAVFIGPSGPAPWENEEMRAAVEERAHNRSFRVIPVLLPGTAPDLPRFLRRLTWCDFRAGLDDLAAFRRLVAGIQGEAPGPDLEGSSTHGPSTARLRQRSFDRALVRLGARPQSWKRRSLLDTVVGQVRTGPLPVVLHGLGGIGKTTLLCQVASELRAEFPIALAVRFDGPAALEAGYVIEAVGELLAELGRAGEAPSLWQGRWQRTLEALLDEIAEEPVLILLDALELADPSWQVELLGLLGALPAVRVVAASRERPPRAVAAHAVAVPPLTRNEALAFVTEQSQTLNLGIEPKGMLDRLPASVISHPQALATLLAHVRDLPLDLVLLEGLPDDARAPSRLVEQAIAVLDAPSRLALATADVLSGMNLAVTAELLQMPLPDGFRTSMGLLRSRSLVDLTGAATEVPALVAEALDEVDRTARTTAAEFVVRHLRPAADQAVGGVATTWSRSCPS
jgi:hypothetical protein